jgi:hypothetical protein
MLITISNLQREVAWTELNLAFVVGALKVGGFDDTWWVTLFQRHSADFFLVYI